MNDFVPDTSASCDDLYTIYVICGSSDNAMHLSSTLVNERLVACVNIQNGTKSFYIDNESLQLEEEITLFMKTSRSVVQKAIERIKELHTYDIACITAWPITEANPAYAHWVRAQVDGA